MANDQRPCRAQHLILRIEVTFKQSRIAPTRNVAGLHIHGPVEIDRDLMHVMHRADEEIDGWVGHKLVDDIAVRRPDPVALEADEDGDGRAVLLAEPDGFSDVRFVAGPQLGDGVLGFNLMYRGASVLL